MNILVTGGAGYIGTHTCVALLNAGHSVVIYDNFCNSHQEAVRRVETISGQPVAVVRGDTRDRTLLEQSLHQYQCHAVIHLAGLKAVGESVAQPLHYYDNNVIGTMRLLEAMGAANVHTLVFSSSATVYGIPQHLPLTEQHPLSPQSPYGRSKAMVEDILRDFHHAHPEWCITLLRYFNPIGAHHSGLLGEDPQGIPNNLMPFIAQVAIGQRSHINVWGNDYPTPDGTGIRDYLHVCDLAEGHLAALTHLQTPQCIPINLGTGQGRSVLEVINAFEVACARPLPYEIKPRRPGDIASYYADPTLAKSLLQWEAKRSLQTMCEDVWRWQMTNPNGFRTEQTKVSP